LKLISSVDDLGHPWLDRHSGRAGWAQEHAIHWKTGQFPSVAGVDGLPPSGETIPHEHALHPTPGIAEISAMRKKPSLFPLLPLLLLSAIWLLVTGCFKSPSSPSGLGRTSSTPIAAGDGQIFFVDSGCSCINPPWPAINITIDGVATGQLPLLGTLAINLPPGPHVWSDDQGDGNHSITIVKGQILNVGLQSNYGCNNGCADGTDGF
jgi:hypothetical protein